jgi:hypothetical protein
MPSRPFAYPQVISRTFALFRVVDFSISPGQRHFLERVRFAAAPPEGPRYSGLLVGRNGFEVGQAAGGNIGYAFR